MNAPGLPHHRYSPRVDERRAPEYDGGTVCLGLSILYGLGLLVVIVGVFA